MTMNDSIKYIVDKAMSNGYSGREIEMLAFDLKELLYNLEEHDEQSLEQLYEELF
jgi:hypothetical protein